ncbi:GntR family transcriptional regulator [Pseudarthrobacter sp. TAF60_1]|uniref:GntR family transcriptional regulator n=1 Tax=Pseudarthrobacter sp. TAF60_1 TaxID=3233071 RepID=UPI003F98A2EB
MVTHLLTVSLVEAIADDIRSRILRGEYPPDASFKEVEVAATYEVARPTAKAAIEKLVAESLLERRSNKTARVVTLTPDDVRDIYRTRARLEKAALLHLAETKTVPAAALAAQEDLERISGGSGIDIVDPDMRFHLALVGGLDSPRTSRMYDSLISQVKLCMAQIQGLHLVQPDRIIKEHRQLLKLIEEGNGAAAAEFLDVHLARPRERLVAAIGGEPGPEAEVESQLG